MTKPFIPSAQQSVVFDWVSNGTGSAFVEAVAGAGKTTTIIEACQRMGGSVAFAAFNKKISDEIKVRIEKAGLSNTVRVGTFHSFGFSALQKAIGRINGRPDPDKCKNMLLARYGREEEARNMASVGAKLISLAKNGGIGRFGAIDDESIWWDIIDHHDLADDLKTPERMPELIPVCMATLKASNRLVHDQKLIDFDDMLYVPVLEGMSFWQNDWLVVDEAQDTNIVRRAVARMMLKPRGRSVWVGDRHQAIYGFSGADNSSVDNIIREFNCRSLPLTVTYRCPKSVVAFAQGYVSHIEAHETAPEGEVLQHRPFEYMMDKADIGPGDAIICRKMAPLVDTALSLIKRGIRASVEGRDIGRSIMALVEKIGLTPFDTFVDRARARNETQVSKLIAKGKETEAEALQDKYDTVYAIADDCEEASQFEMKLNKLFDDTENVQGSKVVLSTVHRAKGREWDRVFILGFYDYMPSKWARQEWQQEQEVNLIYVAGTRAKKTLVLVRDKERT